MLYAIGEAAPGDVLVIQAGGAPLAALGELLATEAARRGLGGIVVDGYVRDRTGLPPDLPLWARGTVPMAGRSDVAPRVGGAIVCGGVRVTPGDLVLGRRRRDRDRAARAAGGVPGAGGARSSASRPRCWRGIQGGASLIDMTNLAEHVARLRRGRDEHAGDHAAELNSNSTSPSVNDSPSPSRTTRVMPAAPSARSSSGLGASGSLDQS